MHDHDDPNGTQLSHHMTAHGPLTRSHEEANALRRQLSLLQEVLSNVRTTLNTPVGMNVITHARKIVEERAHGVMEAIRGALKVPKGEDVVTAAARLAQAEERLETMTEVAFGLVNRLVDEGAEFDAFWERLSDSMVELSDQNEQQRAIFVKLLRMAYVEESYASARHGTDSVYG